MAISAPSHGRAAAYGSAQHGLVNNNGEARVIAVTRLAVLRRIAHFIGMLLMSVICLAASFGVE
jgi:hypothetical protein